MPKSKSSMNNLSVTAAVLPIIYALVTIFITYSSFSFFLWSGLALIAVEFFIWNKQTKKIKNIKEKLSLLMPFILILIGSIGISASTTLTREKIEVLKNPDHVAACSINPVLACGPVIDSDQASAFGGLPNPLIGIFSFGAFLIAGMSILAGGKFASWWWKFLWLGNLFGVLFSLWLAYQTIYNINALCLYCMVVWSVSIPMLSYLTLYMFQQGHFKVSRNILEKFEKNHMMPTLILYAIIVIAIYFQFDYYWNTLI